MTRRFGAIVAAAGLVAVAGCSSNNGETSSSASGTGGGNSGGCSTNADCASNADAPVCEPATGECAPLPQGAAIGWGDGSAASVGIEAIYSPEKAIQAPDLEFNPSRPNELWILRRENPSAEPCNENNGTAAGCAAFEGSIAVVFDPGTERAAAQTYKDINAWHFMRRPPAFAFGDNGNFASAAEARTANYMDDALDFIGPSMWTNALAGIVPGCESSPTGCFSVQPQGGNGSHLDMLHGTPFGMGIAHEVGNTYWLFNGQIGALDRYDFVADHGPGNDFHGDGVMRRFATGQLTRATDIPSHMVFNPADGHVYVADTGAGRIVKLDSASGTPGAPAAPNYENIDMLAMDGTSVVDVVAPGLLVSPSGLDLHDGLLYVTDNATSRMHVFDLDGQELRVLNTDFPAGSLSGITIGPDGKAYFVDMPNGWVFRINPF